MHKYFAKTLFLGKKINFLPECHSTNAELMSKARSSGVEEGEFLITEYQSRGRGQRGNLWFSEPGKNLLFSFILKPHFLAPKESHFLNVIMGLATVDVLNELLINSTISLKWPNDIYVSDKKIGGILIEAIFENGQLETAVVGMGLNINQRGFHVPGATSMYVETGKEFDRLEVLEKITQVFEGYYLRLRAGKRDSILFEYYKVLRWRGELHWFRSAGETFEGEIIGIDANGRLMIKTNDFMRRFEVKEIEFLY